MSLQTFEDFQALSKSEKLGLVTIEAAKRLMGWVLHSGSIYKLTGFDYAVIVALEDMGTPYVAVTSIAGVTAGKYFNDRVNKILYLRASDSSNPNSRFLAMTFRLFFASASVIAPNDLAAGFDVEWLPTFIGSSQYGFALDNQYQLGEAIEGSGSVGLVNDQSYWKPLFDKVTFENQRVVIYSWNRDLPATEAKILFKGYISQKAYAVDKITFTLKDQMLPLRSPFPLALIQDYVGARVPDAMLLAAQRQVYGYVSGHVATPIDQVLDGYPMTGTVSFTNGVATLTGSGTKFLTELAPDDNVFNGDDGASYTIKDVTSDTAADLTEVFNELSISGATLYQKPAIPKRWQNRKFLVAGHATAEPSTTISSAKTTTQITVVNSKGMVAGDRISVGSETSILKGVGAGGVLRLSLALSVVPTVGTIVKRLSVQNVFLDTDLLTVTRDYTYDASTGVLTLDPLAEFNVAPVKALQGALTFTSTSRNVSATGSAFKSQLAPGDWVKAAAQADYFEVLEVTDDSNLILRTAATYSASGVASHYKSPAVFDEGGSVLSLDVLGATEDGTMTGVPITTGAQIVKDILTKVALADDLDDDSFALATELAPYSLALVIPTNMADVAAPPSVTGAANAAQTAPIVRDLINQVNQSIFGSLIQSADFLFQYTIFSPARPSSLLTLKEFDILKFSVESNADKMLLSAYVQYLNKEYDPGSAGPSFSLTQATSLNAQYLAGVVTTNTFPVLLVDEDDAQILANRWAFILEVASSIIKIDTKLQAARAAVTDPIQIQHEKLYQRIGSTMNRKIASVQAISKSATDVHIEIEDLSNAFSRVACIAADGALSYSEAPESERMVNGYLCDDFGMQANDPGTFGVNVIW